MKHTLYKSRFSYTPQNRNLICLETFEDFLLFDCISFNIIGVNRPLLFLIEELGIDKVEELLERKSIEFVTNIPLIASNIGQEINGKHQFKGIQPLISGVFTSPANSDPEYQIDETLKLISGLNRDRKRTFKKIVLKQYKIPKSNYSSDARKLVLDAYKSNKLSSFGLEYNVEPENLEIEKRELLANLGYDVIETGILSQFKYKSKNNNKALLITKDSCDKLYNALQVSNNNSEILRIENIPDLQNLYKIKNYKLSDVFSLRETRDAKKYREWINEKTDELNDVSITKAYIDDIAKQSGFFNTNKGKLIRTISLFTLSCYIGEQVGGIQGTIAGLGAGEVFGKVADFGIDLIDEYILDGLLRGWNPRFFIDEFRK